MISWRRLIWLTGIISLPLAAKTSVDRMQAFLVKLEFRIDSLSIYRDACITENSLIYGKTAPHNGDLSYSDHRKLEKQFRQAQILQMKIKASERELKTLIQNHQDSLNVMISEYQSLIDQSLLKAQVSREEKERSRHIEEARRLMHEKDLWAGHLINETNTEKQRLVLSETPWDNAESLTLKRDALLDQEDALRLEVHALDKKVEDIRKESRLRQKINEMAGEMSLFAENEETMDRVILRGHASNQNRVIGTEEWGTLNTDSKNAFDTSDETAASMIYPYTGRNWENIESENGKNTLDPKTQVTILQEYKNALNARADSLAQQAKWFDEQAKLQK